MTVNKRVSLPSSNYTLSQSMTETESLRDLDAFAAEHTGEGGVGGGGTAATTTFDPAAGIEATDVQAALEELATDVSSIPISDPDPYGLLSDSDALFADEFDDASVDAAWVLTQPGSGTITASEGNHKLALSCTTATSDAGLFVRPLSSFGGAWSDGVTIVEAAWTSSRGITGIARANFCVTDGTSLTSNAVQINVSNGGGSSGTTLIYTFLGTANAPFGGGYVDCGHWFDDVRGRIVSLGAGSVGLQLSVNGDTWRTLGSAVSIGFTPTHVGFLVASGAGFAAFSSDYVRRIA